MCSEIDRLRRSVETLTEALEEKDAEVASLKAKQNPEFDRLLDALDSMATLFKTRFDTLPDLDQIVIRAYDRYMDSLDGEKKGDEER